MSDRAALEWGLTTGERIRARWPVLTAASRRIATVVLDSPRAGIEQSIAELAQQSGTSPATVTRFCRQLGFDGYAAFRLSTAAELGRAPATVRASGRGSGRGEGEFHDRLLRRSVHALQHAVDALDRGQLQAVAALVAASRHVDVYGVGLSASTAAHLVARLQRRGCLSNAWLDLQSGLVSAASQDAHCLAIGFSRSGRSGETLQMLRRAAARGARTVAVVGDSKSPLARAADFVMLAPSVADAERLQAQHGALLIADLLVESLPRAV